jgi:hypothetical protein
MKTVWSLIGSERMSLRHSDVNHEGDDCITALMRFCETYGYGANELRNWGEMSLELEGGNLYI